jgi:hypothetical protein
MANLDKLAQQIKIVKEEKEREKEKTPAYFKGFQRGSKRKYAENRGIYWGSRTAASIKNLKPILTRSQLEQCATEYVNNGIVRTCVDRSAYMIQGDRSDFVIEANEEITATSSEQELRNIRKTLKEDPGLKDLRKKVIRCNKRVQLYDRTDKLLHSTILFGRNALGIVRFKTDQEWPTYGEPQALQHLSSLRISDVSMNKQTYEFEGLLYDYGRNMGERFLPAIDLIPAFWDDNNVQDNSNYSGTSAAWTVLSAAQSIDVILDEDIPESVRQVWAKFGIIYSGTSKKSLIGQIGEELLASTWFIHNQKDLVAQVLDLKNGLMDLPNMVVALAQYVCMSMSLPLFLMFENTANYATAQEVMQVYRNGQLRRQRTWLQGILEKYWYDPMLADHLDVEIEDLLSEDWHIKATFPDVNFEPRKATIEADVMLLDKGVFTKQEVAQDINRDDVANRINEEEMNEALAKKDKIIADQENELKMLRIGNGNGNGNNGQSPQLLQFARSKQQGNNNGNGQETEETEPQ